jgi:hypothetical protein
MSWSFSAVGKPGAVKRAIEESHNNRLTDQSLEEWNEAKPALLTLVGANVGNVVVRVSASGSASFETHVSRRDDEGSPTEKVRIKAHGQCSCTIEPLYGFVE